MDFLNQSLNNIKLLFEELPEDQQSQMINQLLEDTRKSVRLYAEKKKKALQKKETEKNRLKMLRIYEEKAYKEGFQYIVGTDEVGRGCLAGPVVAAAVILPSQVEIFGINDSKKLTSYQRAKLSQEIKEKALAYSIEEISPDIIDKINILHAAEMAMENAIKKLPFGDYVLVDGLNKLNINIPYENIIKGDQKSISISAASIIAKVYRDQLMDEYDQLYPEYGFKSNKGYGTKLHYEAIKKNGILPIHRMSFKLN